MGPKWIWVSHSLVSSMLESCNLKGDRIQIVQLKGEPCPAVEDLEDGCVRPLPPQPLLRSPEPLSFNHGVISSSQKHGGTPSTTET
ncbi:hypothetical protein AAFF_G00329440 [Aldrovandia affinis]|uniref:Uncharacterized protein n=1 Tax=Aldrovandia affinis TaxID=143900 RepID=A0AAD7SM40_9TELE|nr:hypothetical protein AAFF_G00329440 [Aldrovandia affinis]